MSFSDYDFFDYDFVITKLTFAGRIPAGTGKAIHNNRPSYGLAFHLGGEKEYVFGDHTVFTVRENDLIFLPMQSDYVVTPIAEGDCFAINFLLNERVPLSPFVLHIKNAGQIAELFSKTETDFKTKKNGYMIRCKAKLYSLIAVILHEKNLKYIPTYRETIIKPAIEYIHNFYSEKNITIDTLAQICGRKESYFRRIFTQCCGITPIQYINRLKLMRAKEMLSQQDYSIELISELSGFQNVSYFCRYFKKTVGITPTEFRKNGLATTSLHP